MQQFCIKLFWFPLLSLSKVITFLLFRRSTFLNSHVNLHFRTFFFWWKTKAINWLNVTPIKILVKSSTSFCICTLNWIAVLCCLQFKDKYLIDIYKKKYPLWNITCIYTQDLWKFLFVFLPDSVNRDRLGVVVPHICRQTNEFFPPNLVFHPHLFIYCHI